MSYIRCLSNDNLYVWADTGHSATWDGTPDQPCIKMTYKVFNDLMKQLSYNGCYGAESRDVRIYQDEDFKMVLEHGDQYIIMWPVTLEHIVNSWKRDQPLVMWKEFWQSFKRKYL